MFAFVDETEADYRNTMHKHGYGIWGIPPVNHSLCIRGERVSAIACMSMKGILDVSVSASTVDALWW